MRNRFMFLVHQRVCSTWVRRARCCICDWWDRIVSSEQYRIERRIFHREWTAWRRWIGSSAAWKVDCSGGPHIWTAL